MWCCGALEDMGPGRRRARIQSGATRRNIIPNEVKMEITARAVSERAQQIILDGVRRTAQGVAVSAGIPDNLAPIVTVLDAESAPVTFNDPKLTARVTSSLGDT